jgi:RimJ/RimL family protein N-acetyltransferase
MTEIEARRLVLRPIAESAALSLLQGVRPPELVFASGYPSQFSLETMQLVADGHTSTHGGPFFMVRGQDQAIVGEIGAGLDLANATAQVGYSVVQPAWGLGYATEALQALVEHLFTVPELCRRVVADTMADHAASRRVLQKAGMTCSGRRVEDVDGAVVELVSYELTRPPPSRAQRTPSGP